jgi:hypothetical protein
MAAKESINRALEVSLSEGLLFERRNFHALFGTVDQRKACRLSWKSAPQPLSNDSPSENGGAKSERKSPGCEQALQSI